MSIITKMKNKITFKPTLKQRFMILFAVLLLLIAIILGATVRNHLGLTLFQRWFTYSDGHANTSFLHGAHGEDLFATVGYNFLVCSDSSVQLFSPKGASVDKQSADFSNPAVTKNGDWAVAYDADGQKLFVVHDEKLIPLPDLPEEQKILSVTINQKGWLAITSKEDGYKGVVTIYDADYDSPVASWRVSDHYFTNAMVTPDCRGVYILSPGQKNGIFENTLFFYILSEDMDQVPPETVSLGDNVVLSMRADSSICWILSDNTLFTLSSRGEMLNQSPYPGYLQRASLDGNSFAVVLSSPSQSGNTGDLTTFDSNCKKIGTLRLDEPVLDMAASGRYVSVLTAKDLIIYTKNLEKEISRTENTNGVQRLTQYPDGNLMLIIDEAARLYIH